MSEETRALFRATVTAAEVDLGLACLLLSGEVDPTFSPDDVGASLTVLDELAEDARRDLPDPGQPAQLLAEGLARALGERSGFGGRDEDYAVLASSLLRDVLRRRRGLPILLSVVWLEVARRLGVPAQGIGLPGRFVVAIGSAAPAGPAGPVHVDPFAGGRLRGEAQLDGTVRSVTGRPLRPSDLQPWDAASTLLRVLANIRGLGSRSPDPLGGAATSLWATELSLLLPRHPLALRRERGVLLGRLGRFDEAAQELRDYAEAVEDVEPDVAETARAEAGGLAARLN